MTVGTMVTVRRSSRLLELERESVTILGSRVTLLIQLLSPYSPLPSTWYSVQWCFYRYSEFNFAICVHLISLAILCVKYLFWLQKFFFYRWYGLVRWYHRSPNDCLLSYPWVTFPLLLLLSRALYFTCSKDRNTNGPLCNGFLFSTTYSEVPKQWNDVAWIVNRT